MKKLTVFILVLACIFALTGCKQARPGSTDPATTVPPTTAVPPTTVPPTTAPDPATFIEVWDLDPDMSLPLPPSAINGIRLYKDLKTAMQTFTGTKYIFAVRAQVGPEDASKEEVYEAIFKPFITYEELKEDGNLFEVFLSAEQIAALRAPSGFDVAIDLKVYDKIVFITKDNIDEIAAATKKVKVWFNYDETDINVNHIAEIKKAFDGIIADYGITEDMLLAKPFSLSRFEAELDTSVIARMLEDPRIEYIEEIEHSGADYVLIDRATGSKEFIYE